MLTMKNLGRGWRGLFLALAALLAGCTPPGPKALLEGKRLLDVGQYAPAVEQLKIATSLLSSNALAWDYLGLACHHAGLPLEAERAYQRAFFLDRDLAEAHFNLGSLWLEQNKLEPARSELTTFTMSHGRSLAGWLKLGTVQLRLRDPNGADKSFTEALRISPQNLEAINGLGLARAQHGRFTEAAARFTEALRIHPGQPAALLNLAIVSHLYLHDRSGALQRYREYLALSPQPPNAPAVDGLVRQLEAEINAAQHPTPPPVNAPAESGPAAATHHPLIPAGTNLTHTNFPRLAPAPKPELPTNTAKLAPSPPARPSVAPVLAPSAVNAVKPTASPAVRPVSPAAPNLASTPSRTASTPHPAGPTNPVLITGAAPVAVVGPTAATTAPPVVVEVPKPSPPPVVAAHTAEPLVKPPTVPNRAEAQAALDRGIAAGAARRWDDAIQEYEAAVEADPGFYDAYYDLGIAASQAGRQTQAISAYRSALAIRPESSNAHYNLALVYSQLSRSSDAVEELGKLLALYPEELRGHLAIANIYAQTLNLPDKARAHYQRVLELNPRDPQAATIRDWLKAH